MAIQIQILRKIAEKIAKANGELQLMESITTISFTLNRYAKDLVSIMYGKNGPDFGAASDGMLEDLMKQMLFCFSHVWSLMCF